MSFQITILKVLAGHPDGRASVPDLTRYVAVLTSSGADWSQRMKRLAARAPALNIFSSGYVVREESGWLITDLGRQFLTTIETPAVEPVVESVVAEVAPLIAPDAPANVIQLVEHKVTRRRRRAAA